MVRVQATALMYFKRFYTVHSCLEYDPARIMPTCVYVACKVGRLLACCLALPTLLAAGCHTMLAAQAITQAITVVATRTAGACWPRHLRPGVHVGPAGGGVVHFGRRPVQAAAVGGCLDGAAL